MYRRKNYSKLFSRKNRKRYSKRKSYRSRRRNPYQVDVRMGSTEKGRVMRTLGPYQSLRAANIDAKYDLRKMRKKAKIRYKKAGRRGHPGYVTGGSEGTPASSWIRKVKARRKANPKRRNSSKSPRALFKAHYGRSPRDKAELQRFWRKWKAYMKSSARYNPRRRKSGRRSYRSRRY